MPVNGQTRRKFNRQFTFINPEDSLGPGTWRLSTIDEISGSGPGGGGTLNIVRGIDPINSATVAAGEVDISLDISQLNEKA